MEEIDKKREEIREIIADKFLNYQGTNYVGATEIERENALVMAGNVVIALHSQGVVIKSDYKTSHSTPMPAGSEFVAVESLVKTDRRY